MEWFKTDFATLLNYLLPGFVAAWVFYATTAHRVKEPFERIVQALIFTTLIRAIVVPTSYLWNHWFKYHPWAGQHDAVAGVLVALLLGIAAALAMNTETLYWVLGKVTKTQRTAFPSQWYSVFHRNKSYIVLHLDGGRRMRGWAEEWPDDPAVGHFVLMQPQWVDDEGRRISVSQTERFVIPTSQVSFVEFEHPDASVDYAEAARAQQPLLELHRKKGEVNGSPGTITTTQDDSQGLQRTSQ